MASLSSFLPGMVLVMVLTGIAPVHADAGPKRSLADLSLEQLSDIVVVSVSRQRERLSAAAASIFVITGNDIRRAGAQSLPEALRLAPNLQVARVDARNYAISARGFNSPFANKMLVMIDGRSIYSPLFSGVFWDAQDVVMEDIDRIEVISGPGATIWGANAVNGIVNIITRASGDTQGGLAVAGGSANEKNGTLRYGGKLANGGHYRVYGKYAEADDTYTASEVNTNTGWRRRQTGFRTDFSDRGQTVTLQGDVYGGDLGQLGTPDIRIGGANLLGRLTRKLSDGSDMRVRVYLDHTERDQPNAFNERLDTLDLDFQHGIRLGEIHQVAWGAGYRHAWDRVENGPVFSFLPASMDMHWANVFVQDEIELRKALRLTLGAKLEHNNYTGKELLPTVRLAWTPDASQLVWGAVSRTVRAPSRIDRDLYAPSNPPVVGGVAQFAIGGGPDFVAETANVIEIGYRAQPTPALSYSVTVFHSDYDRLRTFEPRPGASSVFSNLGEGTARGIEMWGTWQAASTWRLHGGLVTQSIDTRIKPGSRDSAGSTGLATNDPSHYWMLRSSHDLSEKTQFDVTLRYMGSLPRPVVPSYHEMDMRLGWKVRPDLELSLIGQNLLHASHSEFGAEPGRSVFDRSLFLQMLLRF